MTEVWFRNPGNYIRELVETRSRKVTWDAGYLVKRKLDSHKHAQLYFESVGITDWRALIIDPSGTMELDKDHTTKNPKAVYPTWSADEDFEILEDMIAYPLGEDADVCSDESIDIKYRPVFGQEHRVIITDFPNTRRVATRNLLRLIMELLVEYPNCILHLHGMYSFRVMFGMGFQSVDVDPRTGASKGKVTLPSGREMMAEKTISCPQWVNLLNMRVVDLKEARNRCIYNIRSAEWSGEHYAENLKFKSRGSSAVDITSPQAKPTITGRYLSGEFKIDKGDKIRCNSCSLQLSCKYYREGSVCSVPGSEPAELARFFKTRDSGMIIDGLSNLLVAQTRRMERGMSEEEVYGELDPEVTKIMQQVYNNGVKLAQLVDPGLRGSGTKVQVNVGGSGNAAVVSAATPNQLVASVVREFESRGIPRESITPKMLEGVFSEMTTNSTENIVESHVVGSGVEDE